MREEVIEKVERIQEKLIQTHKYSLGLITKLRRDQPLSKYQIEYQKLHNKE